MNPESWEDGNSLYLAASLKWLRLRLERLALLSGYTSQATVTAEAVPVAPPPQEKPHWLRWLGRKGEADVDFAPPPATPLLLPSPGPTVDERLKEAEREREEAAQLDPPPALIALSRRLGLSPFEQDLLLLCVAQEFDTGVARLCARAHDEQGHEYPTFALALALFDSPSWDALSPHRPLRFWRLIEIKQPGGLPLTASPLRADERIVSYVKGLNALDDTLSAFLSPAELPLLPARADAPLLAPSQQQAAATVLWHWRYTRAGALPPAQLLGSDPASKLLVAQAVAAALGRHLYSVSAETLTAQAADLELLSRLWQRETLLLPLALYVDANEAAPPERFLGRAARAGGVLLVGTRDPLPQVGDAAFTVDVDKPTAAEQEEAWRSALPTEEAAQTDARAAGVEQTQAEDKRPRVEDEAPPVEGEQPTADEEAPPVAAAHGPATPGELAAQFSFNLPDIYVVAESAAAARAEGEAGATSLADPWELCKARTRQRLDILAERLEPKAGWDDIVLGDEPTRLLRAIAAQVRRRSTVYEEWGFGRRMNRGFGISALFAGESGTGKTMAAEVIANDLRLGLYRIDLSAVVSKYIGETEKNLRRLFDAAENGGAILFFDEADALFGKRSEVKDSHDRYANIEINYLLQRMEAFGGLAILATNMKSLLDAAFMRRLRFVVNFTFPGVAERRLMWERAFPEEAPKGELDYDRLARLNLTGGNIHSIALNAAFLAAQEQTEVTMPLVLAATRMEFRKLDKMINESDFRV